jgi:hypothetical protein
MTNDSRKTDEGNLAEEMRLFGDELFKLGKSAFNKGRAFSIDALRRARQTVEKAREELEKSGAAKK